MGAPIGQKQVVSWQYCTFMTSPGSPTPKSRYWLLALGLLSVAVVVVMVLLAYLLLTLSMPTANVTPTHRPVLSLPTAAPPTTTPGPLLPVKVIFAVEEPIKGFSDCDLYGFSGIVRAGNGDRLAGIQVVVWEDQAGLLALDTTDASGAYLIEIQDKPAQPRLWVQLYRADIPVSAPLPVRTHLDCHNGFQVYQINWQELP